ncbi:unnamed protein product [marine sediment metagenome]|uniref:Uncharacterized protein n=1 Tax=marine sediment metagenome TaxID=412755 RepID=X0W0P9_9ZZZZ
MWPFKKKSEWVEDYRREYRMHDSVAWRRCLETEQFQVQIGMSTDLYTDETWGDVPESEYYRTMKLAKEKDNMGV